MDYYNCRLPINGFWRAAAEDEIKTKDWYKGKFFNLKNV